MECEFLLTYINEPQLLEESWLEVVEQHLLNCLTCQELFEVMGGILPINLEDSFSIDMKARILAQVFDEELPRI
ncbi:hypothetical protein [Planococcus faecalis]|uniref:hypothetical protein n=1 Tax=Planococcus faecalis TaxID=1598147 RepID=UPI0008D9C389|nr:hypothetical protein [Planococcus faecalis]OHX51624.1 hypothetical protein BB777_15735 [Planococcus faecalis]